MTTTWQPSASISNLRKRALIINQIRNFFSQRSYLEVETPCMGHYGITDVYLSNITATFKGKRAYLQTSPEYHMKRLLAADSGPIFQLARVFRDDELGRWHNPEFTLLEWYQLDIDHLTLLNEVSDLLQLILNCPPVLIKTYQAAFLEICAIDPFNTTIHTLQVELVKYKLDKVLSQDEQDIDQYLFLIMSHVIEPALAKIPQPIAIIDFPSTQAALAQIKNDVAQRFEVYYQGVELANGFHELTDALTQEDRFKEDNLRRSKLGIPCVAIDPLFTAALKQGVPSCSGVALGLDRLLTLALSEDSLEKVLAFAWSRA
jgi:lysyl-tRNA synthetase class 2